MNHVPIFAWILLLTAIGLTLYTTFGILTYAIEYLFPLLGPLTASATEEPPGNTLGVDWYPPLLTQISNLSAVINGSGTYGFSFDGSTPPTNSYYGGYNYCNMPHVNLDSYVRPPDRYILEFVQVIHRHHKRTPYASNIFPGEEESAWDCNDEEAFYYAKPANPSGNGSSSTYWSVYASSANPFKSPGSTTCQLPQITRNGLDDSWQHGRDLYAVYHDLLHFLPDDPTNQVSYRVTNNVITSQVAGMLINSMYPSTTIPLSIQPASIDSLEPTYPCPQSTTLRQTFGVGSQNPNWTTHLTASAPLFTDLDTLTTVSPTSTPFHSSWDHYFDNLSSRLCHSKPLPCSPTSPSKTCITPATANTVFRLGLYEYNYLYRSAPQSLQSSTLAFGVWIAELAQNIRDVFVAGERSTVVRYRHHVAHDGSLAFLLSILQVDEMVWPGMGAEVVFEVYKDVGIDIDAGSKGEGEEEGGRGGRGRGEERFVRVLWGGEVLRSRYPGLGVVDMVPLGRLLEYFDQLVGVGAERVPGLCGL